MDASFFLFLFLYSSPMFSTPYRPSLARVFALLKNEVDFWVLWGILIQRTERIERKNKKNEYCEWKSISQERKDTQLIKCSI